MIHPVAQEFAEKVINNIQSCVLSGKKFTVDQLALQFNDAINKAALEDTQRIDFLQKGHCVLALSALPEDSNRDCIFEIDGYQGAPQDRCVRKAIDMERLTL